MSCVGDSKRIWRNRIWRPCCVHREIRVPVVDDREGVGDDECGWRKCVELRVTTHEIGESVEVGWESGSVNRSRGDDEREDDEAVDVGNDDEMERDREQNDRRT